MECGVWTRDGRRAATLIEIDLNTVFAVLYWIACVAATILIHHIQYGTKWHVTVHIRCTYKYHCVHCPIYAFVGEWKRKKNKNWKRYFCCWSSWPVTIYAISAFITQIIKYFHCDVWRAVCTTQCTHTLNTIIICRHSNIGIQPNSKWIFTSLQWFICVYFIPNLLM